MNLIENRQKNSFILSLKWKVVLEISVVLIVVNFIVTWVTYNQIRAQFDQNRLQTQQTYEREFEGLVKNSFDRMRQLSYLIPLLKIHTSPGADSETFAPRLKQIIKQHISLLQIEFGLNSLYYFHNSEQPQVVWNAHQLPDAVKDMLRKSLSSEQPQSLLECQEQCNLYTITPLLLENGETGILLLGVSLADLIVEFASISNADIGLITRVDQSNEAADESILLKAWNARLLAVSHAEQQRQLMDVFSHAYSLQQSLNKIQQISWQDKYFEVQLIPLNEMSRVRNTMTLVISDITEELVTINNRTLNTFKSGFLGLLISEFLLFIILWLPMHKINKIVEVLPLFTKNSYSEIREQLQFSNKKVFFDDEIDLLSGSVIDLSRQLENLNQQVAHKTRGLVQRTKELAREKKFIEGLLETTQAIILTQDKQGRIKMLNSKGWALIASKDSSILNSCFDDILIDDDARQDAVNHLNEIRRGEREHFDHEAKIKTANHSRCIISWFHSLLSIRGDDGAVMLSVGIDITERIKAQEDYVVAVDNYEWVDTHDHITGLYNRSRFQNDMEAILNSVREDGQGGALLFLGVDHFKYLNDKLGHHEGDLTLKLISRKLRTALKRHERIYRVGGDEFAIILDGTEETAALKFTQKIIDNIRSTLVLAGSHKISISVGVVLFPEHGDNTQLLISNAVLAIKRAKEKKRGSYHLFSLKDQGRERELRDQAMLRKEHIENAIIENRFVLYFQPIMNVKTGEIKRYETLVRMKEKDGSIQMPDSFIPEAESMGLIDKIDQLVMEKAIIALAQFASEGLDLSLSVNLSGKAMDNPEILLLIQILLKEHDVEPSRLIIEVTETAAVSDIMGAERLMRKIRELGCRFALDDFGVGFSSLNYLKQLPVDYVKLDGMFIRQLPYSADDQVFVKALNEMAHGLDKQTVAEFVENEEIVEMLEKYGVDYAQGYYIGKPLPDILR